MHVVDPTNPRRALGNGIEHRLHVRRRAGDHLQDLGGRRLLIERLETNDGIAAYLILEDQRRVDLLQITWFG